MTYSYEQCKSEYSHLWDNCKINPKKADEFRAAANKVLAGKDKYEDLEAKTGVPWYFIGLVHLRESDCNFHTHLHNGDSLRARTHDVPAGRPPTGEPPFTFEFSAIDALKYEGYLGIDDWCLERIAYCLEKYNGFGYRMRHVPSAYLWAGTNNYSHGKFVSDNVWSSVAVDSQLGAMGVLSMLEIVDTTVKAPYDTSASSETFSANAAVKAPDMAQSRKWNLVDASQKIKIAGGATVAGIAGVDQAKVDSLSGVMHSLKMFVHEYGLFMLIGGIVAGILVDYFLKKYMTQDVTSGRATMSGTLENVDTGESV